MNLSNNQLELLRRIQGRIIKGDIKLIASATGLTREYVSMVLSPSSGTYNETIVQEAVNLVSARDQITQNHLNKLNTASC